ncbi:MAG: hypothetical protein JJU25_14540 [Halomonas sp.]|nr:hypothetical protein [Halomonas sp.]MCC5883836.1 hypothetical protein [Halomonas sp.]
MNSLNAQVDLSNAAREAPSNEVLCRRLVIAKTHLDRMERDGTCKDLSALSSARVEFALASRALADALIAQEAVSEPDDY